MRNKLIAVLCLIPLLAYAAVTITHPSGEVNTFASGSTININGAFAGTPTGGTLNIASLTLTLPTSQALTTPVLGGVTTATSITAPTNTVLAFATLDNNRNITLTPHGTGTMLIPAGTRANPSLTVGTAGMGICNYFTNIACTTYGGNAVGIEWGVDGATIKDASGNACIIAVGNVVKMTAAGGMRIEAGLQLNIVSGSNQRAGDATLVAGTVTVSNTTVTANTRVYAQRKTSGGTIGMSLTYTVSAGASFTLTSDNGGDTSTYSYFLVEVAP